MNYSFLIFASTCQILTFILVFVIFIKYLIFSRDNKNYIEEQLKPIKSEIFDIYEITNSLNNLLNNLLTIIKNKDVVQITENQIISLNDFNILYIAPYEGYLSIEADYCELCFYDDSEIYVKNKLNKFFLSDKMAISIRNIRNLKNIKFEKKNRGNTPNN